MSLEIIKHKVAICSGSENHGHEINLMVVQNPDYLIGEPNRFIKDRWNCYLCLQGEIDIHYRDIGIDRQIDEKNAIMAYIDADTSGYLSYTVIDVNNFIVKVNSGWYPKNELIEYSHPVWLSNMFENWIYQIQGHDVIMRRTFVSQKQLLFVDDNTSEVSEEYSSHYKFFYCILEPNNSITITPSGNTDISFLGDTYTVNGKYMEPKDSIYGSDPITVETQIGNCQMVLVQRL